MGSRPYPPAPVPRLARLLAPACVAALLASAGPASAQDQTPSRDTLITGNGRKLDPAGRMTPVGTFPIGGAISPDGRSYWTVDGGRHTAFVHVVDLASG